MIFRTTLSALVLSAFLTGSVGAAENSAEKKADGSTQDKAAKKEQAKGEDSGPIKLESIFVGDKEQPAISYFIPWQGIGTPDKLYWNVEEKHDPALGTVDRQIMLRSIELYDQMQLENPSKD